MNTSSPLPRGFLLEKLLLADERSWRRWEYWTECMMKRTLPSGKLPRIAWSSDANRSGARKMLDRCLNAIPNHGRWQSWGGTSYFDFFLDWLLFGFGHSGILTPPIEPSGAANASERLLELFDVQLLLNEPHDYLGGILADNAYFQGLGFYPTPMNVCHLMAEMLFDPEVDNRSKSTCDPCVGTGRLLLAASNHSMLLFGMDINPTAIKATLVNGYLYSPWLVKPLPFLGGHHDERSHNQVIHSLIDAAAALPSTPYVHPDGRQKTGSEYLFDLEPDPDSRGMCAPIKIARKRSSPRQSPSVELQPELLVLS